MNSRVLDNPGQILVPESSVWLALQSTQVYINERSIRGWEYDVPSEGPFGGRWPVREQLVGSRLEVVDRDLFEGLAREELTEHSFGPLLVLPAGRGVPSVETVELDTADVSAATFEK